MDYKKPPIGIVPKSLHDFKRISEIVNAIERYAEAEMPVPKEWVEELKQLLAVK